MAITYRSVIAKAMSDFNSIQNAIASLSENESRYVKQVVSGAMTADKFDLASAGALATETFATVISGQLQLKSSGNIELTQQTGTDVSKHATASVRDAAGFGFVMVDNHGTAVTVGTESNGFYPLDVTMSGHLHVTTPGWFGKNECDNGFYSSMENISTGNIHVGKINKGTLGWLDSIESGEDLIVKSDYKAGYLVDTTIEKTISAATFSVSDGTNTFEVSESAENLEGLNNIKETTAISLTKPTTSGAFVLPILMKANASGSIVSTSAGYIKNNKNIGAVAAAGEDVAYVTVDAAAGSVSLTDLSGSSDITPTVSKVETASTNSSINVVAQTGDITNSLPSNGYYIAVKNSGTSTTISATADASISDAGYIPTSYDFTSVTKEKTVSTTETTTYIPITAGSCEVTGGALTGGDAVTPVIDVTIPSQNTTGVEVSDNAPSSGFYVTLSADSVATSSTVTRGAVYDEHTAGYIARQEKAIVTGLGEDSKTVSVNAGNKMKYLTIPSATYSNTANTNKTYVDYNTIDATFELSVADGYLYINEGYTGNTKISLGQLIPDIDKDATASYIRNGYKVYTETGTVLTGTMADTSFSGTYYTKSASEGLEDSIVTAGTYVAETYYIKKGNLSHTLGDPDAITPTIQTIDILNSLDGDGHNGTTFTRGDIFAATGDITTTIPTDTYYIAVGAIGGTSTINCNIDITPGWIGDGFDHSESKTFTVNDSANYYIPVNKAELAPAVVSYTAPAVEVKTQATGITTVNNSAFSITLSNSEIKGSVSAKYAVSGAGFVYEGQEATSNATEINANVTFDGADKNDDGTSTIYIKDGNVSGGGLSASNNTTTSNPTDTGYARTADPNATKDYVKVEVTRAKVEVVEGYVLDSEDIASDTYTVKINATSSGVLEGTAPANAVNITNYTTYDGSTGVATKAYASTEGTADASYVNTVAIGGTTASSSTLDDKYIIGNVTVNVPAGVTTVTVGKDVTGDDVDDYVEALYKRMLGKSYTNVSDDAGNAAII